MCVPAVDDPCHVQGPVVGVESVNLKTAVVSHVVFVFAVATVKFAPFMLDVPVLRTGTTVPFTGISSHA